MKIVENGLSINSDQDAITNATEGAFAVTVEDVAFSLNLTYYIIHITI